jgi:hypothetical protein
VISFTGVPVVWNESRADPGSPRDSMTKSVHPSNDGSNSMTRPSPIGLSGGGHPRLLANSMARTKIPLPRLKGTKRV